MYGGAREIILYLTRKDAEQLRVWLNAERDVAWIVKESQSGCSYRWRAVDEISQLAQSSYSLWHRTEPITLRVNKQEKPVLDPYAGWSQELPAENYEQPIVADTPGFYSFTFRETGKENPNSIGRSGFRWLGNYFRVIGKGASEPTTAWWNHLSRFVKTNATAIPWSSRIKAYAFPDASAEISKGRHADVNP